MNRTTQQIEAMASEKLSIQRILNTIEIICKHHRVKGCKGLNTAAGELADRLTALETADVELLEYPGNTHYGTWLAPENWDADHGWLSVISPEGQQISLLEPRDLDFGLYSYSGSMSPGEPLQIVDEIFLQKHPERVSPAGTLLYTGNKGGYHARDYLVPRRIRGVISSMKLPEQAGSVIDHARRWERMPLTGHEDYCRSGNLPLGISITPALGRTMEQLLAQSTEKSRPVLCRGAVQSKFHPGTFPVLQVIFKGDRAMDEYILLTAHICHPRPSANDNASGAAVALEIASLINGLRKKSGSSGSRGLIILLVPEILGTQAWCMNPRIPLKKIKAAVNLDMLGSDPDASGAHIYLSRPPVTLRSFLPWIAAYYVDRSRDMRPGRSHPDFSRLPMDLMVPFGIGSDHHVLGFPDFNIPCTTLGSWPDIHYHTDADTPARLSIKQLQRSAWISACTVLTLLHPESSAARDIMGHLREKLRSDSLRINFRHCSGLDLEQDITEAHQIFPDLPVSTMARPSGNTTLTPPVKAKTGPSGTCPDDPAPFRRYAGPISRSIVFELSRGRSQSNLETLTAKGRFAELSALAQAEVLIDGIRSVDQILAVINRDTGILSRSLFMETLQQLEQAGLIGFKPPGRCSV